MIRSCAIFFFLFFISIVAQAQSVSGHVVDSLSGKPLPFVNILVDGSPRMGSTTDLDGRFEIDQRDFQYLEFRYVGYASKVVPQNQLQSSLVVRMKPVGFQLKELVIKAGENPAHRIIRRAVKNKEINDPMALSSFQYESYDKLYLTGERQEVTDRISSPYVTDSIVQPKFATVDSLIEDSTDILDTMHLFMMETVSERFYEGPGKDKTNIIANRVSGFERPSIFMLSTLLQPFAFYENQVDLLGTEYLNPLSPGSTKRYFFNIEDTIYQKADSIYVISYRPRQNTSINGLRGVLYINSRQYALQYVLAEPADEKNRRVRIQQQYEWVDGKAWFPTRLHADLLLRNISINNYYALGIARSYIRNVSIGESAPERTFNRFTLEMKKRATGQSDSFWIANRVDPLSPKEIETYSFIDSFSKAKHLERKIRWVVALIRGDFRFGPVEIPLHRIFRYNQYEGVRLGLGLKTNENLSRWFTLEGYGAFAFGDNGLKYGASARLHASKSREIDLIGSYHNDVYEMGRPQKFIRDGSNWLNRDVRHFLVEDMYWEEAIELGITGRVLKYLYLKPFLKRSHLSHPSEYELVTQKNETVETRQDAFYFTEVGVQLRYAFRESLVKSPVGVVSWGTDYPVIWLNYSKGVNWWEGESNHHRLELKVNHTIHWLHAGETEWEVRGGVASGGILPYYKLFSPPGFQSDASFYGVSFNFNTMPIHGYLADRYISGGLSHNFGHFFNSTFFNPDIKISLLGIYGKLDHPEIHKQVEFIPLNQPYLEAGLILDKMIRLGSGGFFPSGFGVGGFYRMGPYSGPSFSDNFAIRLTTTF